MRPQTQSATPRTIGRNELRVLAIDDNATARRILRETLASWEINVFTAETGQKGIAASSRFCIHSQSQIPKFACPCCPERPWNKVSRPSRRRHCTSRRKVRWAWPRGVTACAAICDLRRRTIRNSRNTCGRASPFPSPFRSLPAGFSLFICSPVCQK